MGSLLAHPRVVLAGDVALHYRSADLEFDVQAIVSLWTQRGAPLVVEFAEFSELFHLTVDGIRHFQTFDTDRDGRVDVFEVLAVYVLLSIGEVKQKVATLFNIFDFQQIGALNFTEVVMVFQAVLRGLAKACKGQVQALEPEEGAFFVRSLFDHARVFYQDAVQLSQVLAWVEDDPAAREYVQAFQTAYSLSDVAAKLHGVERIQVSCFQEIAKQVGEDGQLRCDVKELFASARLLDSLQQPEPAEAAMLQKALSDGGSVPFERFLAVLRPWNVYNECDLDGSRSLDNREVATLLWFQLREQPEEEVVRSFLASLDANDDGCLSRLEWLDCILQEHGEDLELAQQPSMNRQNTYV